MLEYLKEVIENKPSDWLTLTTHRLDIYNEEQAKTEFLKEFEALYAAKNAEKSALSALPTAYDYIRLGHPLSSVLEWAIAKLNGLQPSSVISFSSWTAPVMAVLRKNLIDDKKTRIVVQGEWSNDFDAETVKRVYGYHFEWVSISNLEELPEFDGSTVFLSQEDRIGKSELHPKVDFFISVHKDLGSVLRVQGETNQVYISEIQHVRRRETIAMTPANCDIALNLLTETTVSPENRDVEANEAIVLKTIQEVTHTATTPLVGSSGLSVQYAIMMGLVHHALEQHPGKPVRFVVPPNCYGGTNDQARRVAACLNQVEIMDLPVDGNNDMVRSVESVLNQVAEEDAVPYIIAEIPTNPRVEVPDLERLRDVLSKPRKTSEGGEAIAPVFILDQTFCPNVNFLGQDALLSTVQTVAYVSGSKFPSGGKCTAGYCVANEKAAHLMKKMHQHLRLCDNQATHLQMEILAQQLPSMNRRIAAAYRNTREFVDFIEETLPEAKINFVSHELAEKGFTPSVFSLDLPTKGNTAEEKEAHKRALNNELIRSMITEIPNESKYCVSYGQLKGCYWTIPATSTQGTTKEDDKDYIARVSLSPELDLEHHKKVFADFVRNKIEGA